MRTDAILRALGVGLFAMFGALALGCGEVPVGAADDGKVHEPPVLAGGKPPPQVVEYPEGPYGINKGSIIEDFNFIGYANSLVYNAELQEIRLSDFYNPHGRDPSYEPPSEEEDDRLYPEGSQYGELTPKPTVLALNMASVWCGPCNQEAKTELPPRYLKYKPCGGEFLLQLADGPSVGTPATPSNLLNWTKKYKVDYPSTIDPSYRLGSLFQADAYPANIIVDTTTMKIVEVITGVPSESYWDKFEQLLPDPSCPSE
jgi:hypothetical protein